MEAAPDLPVPLSLIGGRYLLFSIDTVTYLRREHHICGVFVGSIPQAPQQNVFLGLPVELMPEEARVLVEGGLAYIVDDTVAHRQSLLKAPIQQRRQYLAELHSHGREAAKSQADVKEQLRAKALGKVGLGPTKDSPAKFAGSENNQLNDASESADTESLFGSSSPSKAPPSALPLASTFGVTPTTSASFLTPPPPPLQLEGKLPAVPDSFPLFKHLHEKGYFVSPGLRFGCQYMVYPGDPLRFHSHFLASHVGWEEELDLMDIVAGGRLGTGVKKGYLIGGREKKMEDQGGADDGAGNTGNAGNAGDAGNVRTFSIEWAGM